MEATEQLRPVPEHIAIIMDGNGRWAQQRGKPRTYGHRAGAETFRTVANYCRDIGVRYLTVYAFSTENWKRAKTEVDTIMRILEDYLLESIRDMKKNRVRIRFFGDLSRLTPSLRALCEEAESMSEAYELQANICLNYGGRDELVRAARTLAAKASAGELAPEEIDEAMLSGSLYSAGIPDPDLLIRPGGEQRISNFLLWQAAYAEFYFTDVLWPDFDGAELEKAIAAFNGRNRRFGGITS